MSPQQQATQNPPRSAPIRRAPARLVRQCSQGTPARPDSDAGTHPWAHQLVQRAAEDHASRHVVTRLVPGEESEVERADAFDEQLGQQARYEPGDQIAGRDGGVAPRPAVRPRYAATIGATAGGIIAAIIRAQMAANEPTCKWLTRAGQVAGSGGGPS